MRLSNNGGSVKLDLYKAGMLADIQVSVWGGAVKLRPEDLGLHLDGDEKELISLGRKRLVKRRDLLPILRIETNSRKNLNDRSFVFPISEARFIPMAEVGNVISAMETYKKEFYFNVNEFLLVYSSLREKMMEEYDQLFDRLLSVNGNKEVEIQHKKKLLLSALGAKYPSPERLRRKFSFDFVLFEIRSPEFSNISAEDALDKVKLNKELEELYKYRMSQKVEDFLDEVLSELRRMILDVTGDLLKRLNGEAKLTMKTINGFKRFAEEFKTLDFVGWDVEAKIDSLSRKLQEVDTKLLKGKEADFLKSFKSDVEEIRKVAAESQTEVLEPFKRMIRFDVDVEAATEAA